MQELADILAQVVYGRELRQFTSQPAQFDLQNLLSAAFFLAVLTSAGLLPSLSGRIRKRRRPRRLEMLREERRVVRWWRHQHPGAFAGSGRQS